jgi:branched-chain amino acid transport system permease protein
MSLPKGCLSRWAPLAVLALPAGVVPAAVLVVFTTGLLLASPGPYALSIATLTLIYVVAALGYNLVLTVGGLFHFGFAAHFAIGAYTAAILMTRLGWETLPSLGVVLIVSAVATVLMALPVLRFSGDYLAMVTLAFAEIVRQLIINWKSVTKGSLGIPGVPLPTFLGFTSISPNYLFGLIAVVATLAVVLYDTLVSSRYGLAWEAIRLNDEAAAASGLRVRRFRLAILVAGSLFAGAAGMAYGQYASIVDPSMSSVGTTVLILSIVVLGGGNWLGTLVASAVLTALPQVFLGLDLYRQLALGLFLIVAMNWRPSGFAWLRRRGFARLAATDGQPVTRSIETPMGEYAIEVDKAVKHFGGLMAVNRLSVRVPPFTVFGIIGPNGAGKTTLFNLISGAIPVDGGTIRVLGQNVTRWPVWRIARLGVGRTFQNIKLFPTLTALDNVLLPAALPTFGRPFDQKAWRAAAAVAQEALVFVGLEARADALAGSLPYADQRRLEIARALAARPRVLLLDEPAAGMNPRELDDLRALVKRIQGRGITIVCIEHNMRFILPIADQIMVMAEGSCLTLGSSDEVVANPAVIEAYLGRRALNAAGARSGSVVRPIASAVGGKPDGPAG